MFTKMMRRLLGLLTAGVLVAGVATNAQAAGTAAGTTISNTASVDYEVDGTSQDTETSNTATFDVDQKVDLSMATDETAVVSVTPGTNDNVLTFTLTNSGNDTFDFDVAAIALNGGSAKFAGNNDNIDADTVDVFVEDGTTAGFQSAEDTATSVDNLAADGTQKIYIVADFNTGYSNGDVASYHLEATAKDQDGSALSEDTDGDDPNTVETAFADGSGSNDSANDAKHSDFADYEISTASLSVSKSSAVVSDPVNGTTDPLAIPGAVVEYTITIDNGADADTASNVTVSDDLSTEIDNGNIAFKTDGYNADEGIEVTAPNINSGSAKTLTNADDGDEGDWNVTAGNTVTVSGITLNGGESATVKFKVTVQ